LAKEFQVRLPWRSARAFLCKVNDYVYYKAMNSAVFQRWLKSKGTKFDRSRGKGSHMYVTLNGKTTVMPTHRIEMPTGTVENIKKQLGLKGEK
jgi:mRNA interferase HicA